MEHLLLIDGHNLLFQMVFGMPARIVNREGRPIQGVIGFVGALSKMIARLHPTHVLVLFDGEHHNLRTDLDPAYKANRPDWSEEEETPFEQLPFICSALSYMGIPYHEVTEGETDDVIAGYCLKRPSGTHITVASWDSDFFQLIDEHIHVLRYRGDHSTLCDIAYVEKTCGVPPCRYADYKALVGDHADNIQGVPKVGPKTAAALITQFGSVDGILAHTNEIARPAVRQAVESARERLCCNMKLIRLSDCVPLPFSMDELRYRSTSERTTDILKAVSVLP